MCRDDMEPVVDCECDYCVGYRQALKDTLPSKQGTYDTVEKFFRSL